MLILTITKSWKTIRGLWFFRVTQDFNHSFYKYLLRIFSVLGPVMGSRNTGMKRTRKLCSVASDRVRKKDNNQMLAFKNLTGVIQKEDFVLLFIKLIFFQRHILGMKFKIKIESFFLHFQYLILILEQSQ